MYCGVRTVFQSHFAVILHVVDVDGDEVGDEEDDGPGNNDTLYGTDAIVTEAGLSKI